jgi:hypothetical protein
MKSNFKNRKQLKKEKKTLRRENRMKLKMKFVKEKELLFSHTPLSIDGMGNITRLINKKGSVPPTETKMYGCEIEKSVPQFVRRFVDRIELGEMIRVPIRTKGLTGSGRPNKCHGNVMGIVNRFGGKILRGYSVTYHTDGMVTFLYHSVWITPEGKSVCVTNNYGNSRNWKDQSLIRKGDKEYMLFIPFGLGLIDELGFGVNQILFGENWEIQGVSIKDPTCMKINGIPPDLINEFQNKFGFIQKDLCVKGRWTKRELKNSMNNGGDGFSQKSLGSGKSWDELKSEIVW